MKKLFPIVAVLCAVVLLPSCKKNYTCKCTMETRGQNHSYTQSEVLIEYTDVTHSEAQTKCSAEADNYNNTHVTDYVDGCSL